MLLYGLVCLLTLLFGIWVGMAHRDMQYAARSPVLYLVYLTRWTDMTGPHVTVTAEPPGCAGPIPTPVVPANKEQTTDEDSRCPPAVAHNGRRDV